MILRTLPLAFFALVANSHAQDLLVGDPVAVGFFEQQAVSPLTPGGGVPVGPFPALFPLPPGPPGFTPAGGVTFDGNSGLIYHSDGLAIAVEPHPFFNPTSVGAPVPPTPIPPVIGLPITGLAIDSAAGLLWITDGFSVIGLGLAPGFPPATPPFGLPFAAGPLAGLDWDPLTGTLWGVDIAGVAFNFFAGGAPAGVPVPPPFPLSPNMPAAGIAIDKTGALLPTRPLYVLSASTVVDYSTGAPVPSFVGGVGFENGLCFLPLPSMTPPLGVCPCAGVPFALQIRGPMTNTNPSFGVDITGLPPGYPVFYGFDFSGFNPAFPVINGIGCGFGLTAGGLFGFGTNADPAGNASFPFSLVGVPLGLTFYTQQILPCPSDPVLGLVLTPMQQIVVSAP